MGSVFPLARPGGRGRGLGPVCMVTAHGVVADDRRTVPDLAQRYLRGQNPIGRRWGNSSNFASDGIEIVGVVTDARYNDVKAGSIAISYMPALQSQRYLRSIEVRSSGNPAALAGVVRRTLRETEPRLAVGAIETLDVRIVRSIRIERLLGWLTMAFGGAALSLACLGLFGTISNAVKRRTAEPGIRVALGADRRAVQWLIVREALLLVAGRSDRPATRLARRPRAPRSVLWDRAIRFRLVRDGRWRADCGVCVRRIHPGVARFAARSDRGAAGRMIAASRTKRLVLPRKDQRAGRPGIRTVLCSHSM